ncbi:SWR1 complex subunit 2-like [Babesia ovis]|uniref:SWR1 complex subunit 2-like n=1 Tax=Babesia ovis TaxID=5869 RepID=A0A9W5WVM6_BABOV|nr:SWR1 complex subunit 2-like [Babesia ovis]
MADDASDIDEQALSSGSSDEPTGRDTDELDPEEDGEEEEEADSDDEREDDSDEDDSDDESSFDEMSVGVALELPKRQSRGKKYTKLLGEELEKDQQFWGHNTWEEEAVDEDYNCSEGEEQYAYSTDSDFDDPETDKSDEEVDESHLKERKKRKHGSYVDPALQRHKLVRRTIQRQNASKPTSGDNKTRHREVYTNHVELNVDRAVRASTKIKTEATAEMQRMRGMSKTESGSVTSQKKRVPKKQQLTQEQLMEMALKTEAANTRSLEKMQAWEDEKKYYEDIKKWNYKGNYDIWVCWNSLLSIVGKATDGEQEAQTIPSKHVVEKPLELYMFTSGKVPEYYTSHQAQAKCSLDQNTPVCAITGNPARYIDPVTGCYYSNCDAYTALKMGHTDSISRQIALELDRLEEMLDQLYNIE